MREARRAEGDLPAVASAAAVSAAAAPSSSFSSAPPVTADREHMLMCLPARRPWFLVCSQVVEVDRSFQIDAAIVRIMKMRRRFAHEKLVSETTEQLLSHFHADPKQIKRRIEHLIEREYAPPLASC